MWELMPLSHLLTATLTSNQPAAGHTSGLVSGTQIPLREGDFFGRKSLGGFRRGFFGGDVTWPAGRDHSSKSGSVCMEGPVLREG